MDRCDICEEMGLKDCMNCEFGNPCLGCPDYNEKNYTCTSNGACGEGNGNEEENG